MSTVSVILGFCCLLLPVHFLLLPLGPSVLRGQGLRSGCPSCCLELRFVLWVPQTPAERINKPKKDKVWQQWSTTIGRHVIKQSTDAILQYIHYWLLLYYDVSNKTQNSVCAQYARKLLGGKHISYHSVSRKGGRSCAFFFLMIFCCCSTHLLSAGTGSQVKRWYANQCT